MTNWQQEKTNSDRVKDVEATTRSEPFHFYVPGIGDLVLVKLKDKPDFAEIVLKKDGTPPDPYATILFDTLNFQVRIIDKECNPTSRDRFRATLDRITRSLLKVLYVSLGCAYSFGFVSTVVDLALRSFLQVRKVDGSSLTFRLVYGFVWGYFSGALLRPACTQVETMLGLILNRLGRASAFQVLQTGYMPYFWTEDLPEFTGFIVSTPICELLRVHLGLMKAMVRSVLGMSIGVIFGELIKLLSSTWHEFSDADVIRDRFILRLRSLSIDEDEIRKNECHHDVSMGIIIGLSETTGQFFWFLIERGMGSGLTADILGSTNTIAIMMLCYKIHSRCMIRELSAFLCRELRASVAKHHETGSTEQFVLQSDIDDFKKNAICTGSRCDSSSTFKYDLTGCL